MLAWSIRCPVPPLGLVSMDQMRRMKRVDGTDVGGVEDWTR